MWPSSHLAIGYLLYSGYTHLRYRHSPEEFPTLLVLFGSLLPDLIDKPLWLAGVVSTGRALGHSILFVFSVIAVVCAITYCQRGETDSAVGFGVSITAASIFDGLEQFLHGSLVVDLEEVSFWVWPLELPAERIVDQLQITPGVAQAIAHKPSWTAENIPRHPELGLWIRGFEIVVTVLALCVWAYDSTPGWQTCRYLGLWMRERIATW